MSEQTLADLRRDSWLTSWHCQRYFTADSAFWRGAQLCYSIGPHVYHVTDQQLEQLARWIAEGARLD